MSLKNNLLNQKGFTLTEMLIALGIVGGISLVGMKIMSDQATNQSYIKGKGEIDKAVSLTTAYLADRSRCDAFVNGANLNQSLTKISSRNSTEPNERVILRAGTATTPVDYGDFLMDANSIRLESPTVSDPTDMATNRADLVLRFRLKNTSFLKALSRMDNKLIVKKTIPIPIVRNASGVIESCGDKIGDAETRARQVFCESLNSSIGPQAFTWSSTMGTCTAIEKECPVGQVMTQVTSLGGYICDNAVNHVVLENLFDLETEHTCPNGFSLIRNSDKKIQINCNP